MTVHEDCPSLGLCWVRQVKHHCSALLKSLVTSLIFLSEASGTAEGEGLGFFRAPDDMDNVFILPLGSGTVTPNACLPWPDFLALPLKMVSVVLG